MKLSTVLLTAFALNVDAGKGNRRKQSRQANSGTFTIPGLCQSYLRTRAVQSFRRPWPQTSELIVKLQKLNVIKNLSTLEQQAQLSLD